MTISLYPQLGSTTLNPISVVVGNDQTDAFGRVRVSTPYTLFDSQARYAEDTAYSYLATGSGTSSYNTNQSSVSLTVGTAVGTSVAQTYRVFPYQPGKSLFTMQTFTMAASQTNLTQKVGYFSVNNGVYFQQSGSGLAFVLRTYTSGSVTETVVAQANWNGDPLNGTGSSGITLDVTKTQILFFDFEWLGVGAVRCGFIINGKFYNCHTFYNANTTNTVVYMQTAILPLRYEINAIGTVAGTPVLQQICSTVISEGGYEQISQQYVGRLTSPFTLSSSNTFYPLVAMRLNASYLGAVVLPISTSFVVASGTGVFEVVLVKNVALTGATWAISAASGQVDIDVAATAFTSQPSGDSIVQSTYATVTNQSNATAGTTSGGYNWDLQLGVAAGASSSDYYVLAARQIGSSGATCLGSISFYNLTV